MSELEKIGEGVHEGYRYEVFVDWNYLGDPPRAILLSRESVDTPRDSVGGCFPLSEMLEDKWTEHLEICGCLRLRDIAREEKSLGRYFTANEISDKWSYRVSPAVNLVGEVFGSLIVIGRDDSIQSAIWWICRCQCGEYRTVEEPQLVSGEITACGRCSERTNRSSEKNMPADVTENDEVKDHVVFSDFALFEVRFNVYSSSRSTEPIYKAVVRVVAKGGTDASEIYKTAEKAARSWGVLQDPNTGTFNHSLLTCKFEPFSIKAVWNVDGISEADAKVLVKPSTIGNWD